MKPCHPRRESGFTLVEMIVVLFVISVVLMIALPDLRQSGVKAQKTTCEANQRLIRTQLENYYLDHGYQYPFQGQTSASQEILAELQNKKYLQTIPSCPSGGEYQIVIQSTNTAGASAAETEYHARVSCSVHQELGL